MAAAKTHPGAKAEKLMRQALLIAVNRPMKDDPQKRKKLQVMADKLVDAACAGEIPAIKEIADRIDGKATQPLEHAVDESLETLLDRIAKSST